MSESKVQSEKKQDLSANRLSSDNLKEVHGGITVEETIYLLGPAGQSAIRNKLSMYKNDSLCKFSREEAIERAAGYFSYNNEIYEAAKVYAESVYDSL
jgi:hypothetical protein